MPHLLLVYNFHGRKGECRGAEQVNHPDAVPRQEIYEMVKSGKETMLHNSRLQSDRNRECMFRLDTPGRKKPAKLSCRSDIS